jgi:HSP20 family protein
MPTRFVPMSSVDRLAAGLFSSMDPFRAPRLDRQIPVDAFQRGEELLLHFDLPGIPEDAVELSLERRVLTVKAQRQYAAQEGDQVLMAERPWGTLSRQVVLGDTLDTNRIQAHYDNGVLTVSVPLSQTAKTRKIEIGHAPVDTQSHEVEGDADAQPAIEHN